MTDVLLDSNYWTYQYFTDFVINVANLTGLSYYEINVIIFCSVGPGVTVGLVGYVLYLRVKLMLTTPL